MNKTLKERPIRSCYLFVQGHRQPAVEQKKTWEMNKIQRKKFSTVEHAEFQKKTTHMTKSNCLQNVLIFLKISQI